MIHYRDTYEKLIWLMSFIGDNEDTHNQQSSPPPAAAAVSIQQATKGCQVTSQAPNNTQQVYNSM